MPIHTRLGWSDDVERTDGPTTAFEDGTSETVYLRTGIPGVADRIESVGRRAIGDTDEGDR